MTLEPLKLILVAGLLIGVSTATATAQTEDAATESGGLRVSEFGVGTDVKARNLVGKGEAFPAGSRVWFWTRVRGGADGDRIRHVWLFEGKEVFSVGLAIGGDHWRTYSNKTLPLARVGEWSAEARDSDDRVLARQKFRCLAASGD